MQVKWSRKSCVAKLLRLKGVPFMFLFAILVLRVSPCKTESLDNNNVGGSMFILCTSNDSVESENFTGDKISTFIAAWLNKPAPPGER